MLSALLKRGPPLKTLIFLLVQAQAPLEIPCAMPWATVTPDRNIIDIGILGRPDTSAPPHKSGAE